MVGLGGWMIVGVACVGAGGGLSGVRGVTTVAGGGGWLLGLGWPVVGLAGVVGGVQLSCGEA